MISKEEIQKSLDISNNSNCDSEMRLVKMKRRSFIATAAAFTASPLAIADPGVGEIMEDDPANIILDRIESMGLKLIDRPFGTDFPYNIGFSSGGLVSPTKVRLRRSIHVGDSVRGTLTIHGCFIHDLIHPGPIDYVLGRQERYTFEEIIQRRSKEEDFKKDLRSRIGVGFSEIHFYYMAPSEKEDSEFYVLTANCVLIDYSEREPRIKIVKEPRGEDMGFVYPRADVEFDVQITGTNERPKLEFEYIGGFADLMKFQKAQKKGKK